MRAVGFKILHKFAETGTWPEQYQTEWGTPIEKTKNPSDESQTRVISCTNKMNLVFEKQVLKWLMQFVKFKLDPDQFGGMKGNSINHYIFGFGGQGTVLVLWIFRFMIDKAGPKRSNQTITDQTRL